jgi:hypothetical protein
MDTHKREKKVEDLYEKKKIKRKYNAMIYVKGH